MSTAVAVSSTNTQRQLRSRSSSMTDSQSPDSTCSDSLSSSDPDTQLSSLSSWLQTPTAIGPKSCGMDIDAALDSHMMELDPEMSLDDGIPGIYAFNAFQSCSFDDLVLNNTQSNAKSDMLSLEEIIRDGVFDPSPIVEPPISISSTSQQPGESDTSYLMSRAPGNHPDPHPACVEPFSTQTGSQQHIFPIDNVPSPSHKTEAPGVLMLSPDTHAVDDPRYKNDPSVDQSIMPCQPRSIIVSQRTVFPPKQACFDLPMFFPTIPMAGTKSRVETQIKLAFELIIATPQSSPFPLTPAYERPQTSSSQRSSPSPACSKSPSASPSFSAKELPQVPSNSQQFATHDKVGTYRFLQLPQGTTTKRRTANSISGRRDLKANDEDPQDTLHMSADVVCSSPPHAIVQSCPNCQSREAKRTARKLAARVRPPPGNRSKSKSKNSAKKASKMTKEQETDVPDMEEEDDEEEPNVDGSILQFNCTELLDFSSGGVVLPMRITCYCRHHKEKMGFNIIFTLRDCTGRVVGRGTTPPILITDDHKSTNAVSKLPPLHPLRQMFNPPIASSVASPQTPCEELSPLNTPEESSRAPTKRREADTIKKRRPKPYDGRPVTRALGFSPGIESRNGIVLALHPSHARLQASTQAAKSVIPNESTPLSRGSSSPATRSPTPSFSDTAQVPTQPATLSTPRDGISNDTSPYPPSPRASISSQIHMSSPSLPQPSQIGSDFRSHSQEHEQNMFNTSTFPLYPSLSFPPVLPRIHRLIPSSGPTTGGIEITVLGSNFHTSLPIECIFGGAVASSTHRWSDNTLVCVLPPRATPGLVNVEFKGIKNENQDDSGASLFTYVDESDRQLMELALQVVGLKMTGKIEEARNVAMRIVGNTPAPTTMMTPGELSQMSTISETAFARHTFLGSLSGLDLETLVIKLLTLFDVPADDPIRFTSPSSQVIQHKNATGQTLLHLAALLTLPSLISCLIGRSIDIDARNNNGLTALHFAAMTGWKDGVEMLLTEGADATIVDSMGLTAAQRAEDCQFEELVALLNRARPDNFHECESGEEGDDEAWQSESEQSDGSRSEVSAKSWTLPQYSTRSRLPLGTHIDSSPDEEFSENDREKLVSVPQSQDSGLVDHSEKAAERPAPNEKQDASFVERLQRNLPHGILPNVQIPGFPQLQLPDRFVAPWGVLPQIPVFPILVPIPNLPHLPNWPAFPWDSSSGDKKNNQTEGEAPEEKQQPPLAMLWTAYGNLTNNAWRAQWEKWTAQVTALQNANNHTDLPPYSPRRLDEQQRSEVQNSASAVQDEVPPSNPSVAAVEDKPTASTSRMHLLKPIRRIGYGAMKVPETEVDSYHYRPKKQANKQDRMLILFWIPILFLGLAYALYTTLPIAVAGVSRAAKRIFYQPLQRGHIQV